MEEMLKHTSGENVKTGFTSVDASNGVCIAFLSETDKRTLD